MSSARSPRLSLRDVTLCAIDCVNPALALRALSLSLNASDFADAILLTDATLAVSPEIRLVPIEPIRSSADYSQFMLKELHRYISTPWVLVVQWDGYVIHPQAWCAEFFNYDYIGARWPGMSTSEDVGNGGFSLRSARLLSHVAQLDLSSFTGLPEDAVIGRALRNRLETEYGMRFAPASVADRFSYEFVLPDAPTFGFHGATHLWRYVGDSEMLELLRELDRGTLSTNALVILLFTYAEQRKFDCMDTLFARVSETLTKEDIVRILLECGAPSDRAAKCIALCTRAD